MLSLNKILVLVGMGCLGVGLLLGLPVAREFFWGEEGPTIYTSLPYDPALRAEEESLVVEAMKRDSSKFDRALDTRFIEAIPIAEAELEAAFRNRKADRCDKLPAGDNMLTLETFFPSRVGVRPGTVQGPNQRRPVLSMGLEVSPEDQASLPKLSKGQILQFLDDSWLSLQARLYLSAETNEWRLHYRPVAAQGSFASSAKTQRYEPTVEKTLEDVRGLGIISSKIEKLKAAESESIEQKNVEASEDPAKDSEDETPPKATVNPHTAVWLVRSERQESGDLLPQKEFEFIFVHIAPSSEADGADPWELHVVCTTDQRRVFHYFEPTKEASIPRTSKDCSLRAAVHFTKYGTGGLSPTQSVTRSIQTQGSREIPLAAIESYLNENGFSGPWQTHLPLVLEGIFLGL